ncbi:hypothetical protein [Thalassotalea sp. ND16A]|uniref:hypothetical protein n=1 Tax=Thalassotalea sp. ND16A TaxID=1535422 RepID=UPI00051A55C1|nr:hypothetical protein [Thalassotalea sp. ND16A]
MNIQRQNLQPWLIELIDKMQHSTDISIKVSVDDEVFIAHDAKFLQRAIQNLLVNAANHQPMVAVVMVLVWRL